MRRGVGVKLPPVSNLCPLTVPITPLMSKPRNPRNPNQPEPAPVSLSQFDPTAAPDGEGVGAGDVATSTSTPIDPDYIEPPPLGQTQAPPPMSPTGHNYAHMDDDGRTWIHPPADTKGHSVKLQLRCPPMIGRQIELALNTKFFPYRSGSDLIRHALYRHLQWLTQNAKPMPSLMTQVDAMLDVVRDDQLLLEQQNVLGKLQEQCQRHLGNGDGAQAKRIIETAMASINAMPPGGWRDSYRQRFNQMFQWAMKPAAKMKQLSMGGDGNGNMGGNNE